MKARLKRCITKEELSEIWIDDFSAEEILNKPFEIIELNWGTINYGTKYDGNKKTRIKINGDPDWFIVTGWLKIIEE